MKAALRAALLREEPERPFESFVEAHARAPVQETARLCGVYAAAELLAGLGRPVPWREVLARGPAQPLVEAGHARLHAGAYVVRAVRRLVLHGEHVRPGDVFDKDVVAGLLPRAVDGGGAALGQVAGEDGHDPGLAVRVLAGAVDVGVAQRGG